MEIPLLPCREALLEICDMCPAGERLKASDGQGFKTSAVIPTAANAGPARLFDHMMAQQSSRRSLSTAEKAKDLEAGLKDVVVSSAGPKKKPAKSSPPPHRLGCE
jgi:hypothetical protein